MNSHSQRATDRRSRVFRDLRAHNERREAVAKLLESQRKRRIQRGIEAQLEHWARDRR